MGRYHIPRGYSFASTYLRAVRLVNNPIESMIESFERFGDSYTVYSGFTKKIIITQDPELIEHVLKKNHKNYYKSPMLTEKLGRFLGNGLLTSNGAYWLRQRRLIQPGFHIQKIAALYQIMKETIDGFLSKSVKTGTTDIYPVMNKVALEVVINTLFNIEMPTHAMNELSGFISETQDFFIRDVRQPHKSWWHSLSGEVKKNLKKAAKTRNIIRSIIRQRRDSSRKYNDLLDMLMEARYEDTGAGMSEIQIIDEIMVLIIAGHETTANTLSWALYLLATHPEELEKLRTSTAGSNIHECVSNPFLQAAIYESMRLYPPAWISDRMALGDDAVKNYTFPADTVILLFYYGLHRNEKYWKNATHFKPQRFLENKDNGNVFYPFGGGPRLCIGNNFAMAEMCIFLQGFIHRFDFNLAGTPPMMNPLVTLRPDKVLLNINART